MTVIETIKAGKQAKWMLNHELVQRFDTTFAQYEAAKALSGQEAVQRLGHVAETLDCSRGNLTGLFDRLEVAGRVERVRSKADRRIVTVRLVDREWLQQVDAFVQEFMLPVESAV